MSDLPYVLEATQENFPKLVLENSRKGLVLVDFWASYAGPSLRQRELLLRLTREYGGRFLLVTVSTEREKTLASELGVKSIPSCKLYRNGQPVEHLHGMQTETDYRALIERHLAPLADKVQAAALTAWEHGEHEKAIQVLAEGAMAAPDDPALPLLLAKLLVREGRHEAAYSVLSAVPAALKGYAQIRALHTHLELILAGRGARPVLELEAALAKDADDAEARFALASAALVADDLDRALEQLAELDRRASDYRDGLPRRAIQVLLDTLDPQDPRVRRFRQRLFNH
jgi:putative thioredoxin